MKLKSFGAYGVGNTPMYRVREYCPSGNLYLKLENTNPLGSIKDRTAYYMVNDLIETGRLRRGVKLTESTSGNLGLAIAYFAREVNVRFLCLVDPSLPPDQLKELEDHGVEIHVVSLGNNPDYRAARIGLARELDQQSDWIWTNQYDNPANFRAHYETTGPEIWSQTEGQVDYIVCSVGTGGTICGVGHYLKQQKPAVKVVAVEPKGSTIFGGKPSKYLTAGAGMRHPSGIFTEYGYVVDYYCKVDDTDALQECVDFVNAENLNLGVTTGSVLLMASRLAARHPDECVVAVAPDGGEIYSEFVEGIVPLGSRTRDVNLVEYHPKHPPLPPQHPGRR